LVLSWFPQTKLSSNDNPQPHSRVFVPQWTKAHPFLSKFSPERFH
jgi:hypothetical protein